MEAFSVLLTLCAGNSPVTGEFPTQRPVTRSFDVFFYLRPNKRLSKQWWGWWFETPCSSLWRHTLKTRSVYPTIAVMSKHMKYILTHWGLTKLPQFHIRHFQMHFLEWKWWFSLKISLKFVPKLRINNILALIQIMTWRNQAASHYLRQWWLVYWRIHASLGLSKLRTVQC